MSASPSDTKAVRLSELSGSRDITSDWGMELSTSRTNGHRPVYASEGFRESPIYVGIRSAVQPLVEVAELIL